MTTPRSGAFIYDSAPAVSRMLDSTLAAIHDTTPLAFYGVVSGTLARLRDGHTPKPAVGGVDVVVRGALRGRRNRRLGRDRGMADAVTG